MFVAIVFIRSDRSVYFSYLFQSFNVSLKQTQIIRIIIIITINFLRFFLSETMSGDV